MMSVNGLRTHYQWMRAKNPRPGGAPTVVCVHGIGYDSLASFYLTLASPLSEAGYDVLTYDLRGHGRTERPATGYRLGDFVDDFEVLLKQLQVDGPIHLLGNSFGGTLAFSYAVRNPGRVASIVGIESEPATEVWSDKMSRTMANVVELMGDEGFLGWVTEIWGKHHARLNKAAAEGVGQTSIVAELAEGPLLSQAELDQITCPVLSIVGDEGYQQDDLGAVAALLPDCRTEVIEGQDHSVLVERHQTVRKLLLSWLDEHEAGSVADELLEDGAA
ncbi:MAG TPA: alpha/beta hydrolase [Pseudonocardiaceae bacterium]|nr:alpha/beta hydrolase [Pseudonocardiaceae bacterium]